MRTAERLVVFRPGALGDTLLTVGALAGLRRAFPGALIELVGHGAGQVLRRAGLVDAANSFDSLQVAGLFLSSAVVSYRWHGARLVVLWLRRGEWLLPAFEVAGAQQVIAASPEPEGANVHVGDHLVHTLAPAGVESSDGWPRLELPARVETLSWRSDRALVHPGSGSPRKNWAPQAFAGVLRALRGWGIEPILVCGPADDAAVSDVLAELQGDEVEIIRPRNVSALAALLAEASLYVGNDSGVSHLASLLGVPSVAIFGTTDPARWAPRGERVEVLGGPGSWPTLGEVLTSSARLLNGRARISATPEFRGRGIPNG